MEKIITYNFGEDFIANLAALIDDNFSKGNNDLSRVACIFGGRRPALFLQRELFKKINRAYIPPTLFSMDEFIDYLIKPLTRQKVSHLDACFLVYGLAKKYIPTLLPGRESFSSFLPWAGEIVSFIDQLDLEDIDNQTLSSIERCADIGYEIPQSINHLLKEIISLREAYHKILDEKNISSRGVRYLQAVKAVEGEACREFEKVLFCNFFYLHKTEQRIVKSIYQKGKGVYIFQGSQDKWSVLKDNAKKLNISIKPEEKTVIPNFFLYHGFDMHSQIALVRDVLKGIKNKDNTLIVLPQPGVLIPLLTEISSFFSELNVSLGYPLDQSALYVLLILILKAQESRKGEAYYAKDYLNLLRHPLVKSLGLKGDSAITRVIVHKIEEFLEGGEETSVSGNLFLSLKEVEAEEKIYLRSLETLQNMDVPVDFNDCKMLLVELNKIFFKDWEEVTDFDQFSDIFSELLKVLAEKSNLKRFPFNLKVIEKLYKIGQELKGLFFSKEKFETNEVWDIFRQKLKSELISFTGSPLRGAQVLGFLETRSLSFENVIIIDLNESVLPRLKVYEPLIPREVMLGLGLRRLEKEEEIQRYHFMRLISSAKKVHLIYEENQKKEKSRFVEELLWMKQSQTKRIEAAAVPKARFSVEVLLPSLEIKKTENMVLFLKEATYSVSRLNTYLNCPLRFYYQYVLGLREKEDLFSAPQAKHIGTFIHELLADTFKIFIGRKPVIDAKFKKMFFAIMEDSFQKLARRMKSDSFLLKKIIINRMDKFLESESERKVAKVIALEKELKGCWELDNKIINFKYTVDRVDEMENGDIVIIDYKTGGANITPKGFLALSAMGMDRESIKKDIKSFQMPLYYYFTAKEYFNRSVNAEIYNLRTCQRKSFISKKDLMHREKIQEISLEALGAVFRELFNSDMPFVADKDKRMCQFCPFALLCG